jgi:hypothetical protein
VALGNKNSFMKLQLIGLALAGTVLYACNEDSASTETMDSTSTTTENSGYSSETSGSMTTTTSYVDLNTNEPIELVWDDESNRALNKATNQPVTLYINTATRDTIYGPGYIVNHHVIQTNTGKWELDNTKIKRDGDELKIKKDGQKFKMEDGEWKMKSGDTKIKVEDDESKIKTGDTKIKTEDGETKVKN